MKEMTCWITKNSYDRFRNGDVALNTNQISRIHVAKPMNAS